MRSHAGVAARMFETLSARGHQHPDDLDLGDRGLLRDRGQVHRARRARPPRRLRARAPSGGPRRADAPAIDARPPRVFFGPGKPFEIREVADPRGRAGRRADPRLARQHLRLRSALLARRRPLRLPEDGWIFGHEMTGRVAKLGARVKTDSLGRPLQGGRPRRLHLLLSVRALLRVPQQGAGGLPEQDRAAARAERSSRTSTARSPTTTTCGRAARSSRCPTRCPTRLVASVNCALSQVIYGLDGSGCASATAW